MVDSNGVLGCIDDGGETIAIDSSEGPRETLVGNLGKDGPYSLERVNRFEEGTGALVCVDERFRIRIESSRS